MQGNRVWVWVVALKSFGLELRHRTRRGEPFDHDMLSYFADGFPNAIALLVHVGHETTILSCDAALGSTFEYTPCYRHAVTSLLHDLW